VKTQQAGVSLSQKSIKASWDVAIEPSPKRSSTIPFGVDGLLEKVHLNQQGLGLRGPEIMELVK
jgi:hypothetical protein